MSWYWWVLIWAFVLLLTLGVLATLGLSLFRKAKALLLELADASQRLAVVSENLQDLAAERQTEAAVFTSASQLRQEQFLSGRHRGGRSSAGQTGQKPQPGTRSTRSPGQRVR